MLASAKRWKINEIDEQKVQQIMNEQNISRMMAKYFVSRGFFDKEVIQAILNTSEDVLHDPLLFFEMEAAVERVKQAINLDESILVYGDYDADGVTSTSLLVSVLQDLGANVTYRIPNRFEHGYGPSVPLFKEASQNGVNLIITVDNGVSGHDAINVARELNVDVIVTDHHEIGETLPNANFIIHPRHPKGNYPFAELAGVGVAYKFASALLGRAANEYLDFVAIGTVADLVPLLDENRYFVKNGLQQMKVKPRLAITSLSKICSFEISTMDENTLGFIIGPRLNALGRLGDAAPAVSFLTATSQQEALELADSLNKANKERQAIVSKITEEAIQQVEETITQNSRVIVVAKEGWNPGVVGIVASKLVDKYYLPTIVLGIDKEKKIAKGSARSIEGFHLYDELSKNKDILPHFGGHPMAAGMTLAMDDVEQLRKRLNDQATECLTEEQLIPIAHVDIDITLEDISVETIASFDLLKPFGMNFPKPIFALQNVKLDKAKKIGASGQHAKLVVRQNDKTLDIVAFNKGALLDELTEDTKISLIGDLQVNEWNGNKSAQMLANDIRVTDWQLFDIRGIRQVARWENIIPNEKTVYVAFQTVSKLHFQTLLNKEVFAVSELDNLTNVEQVVLLDLPETNEQLEKVFETIKPTRIYIHFHADNDIYLEGIPSKEHFKWYYGFLLKRQTFHLKQHVEQLAKHKGWSEKKLFFMSHVFFELGFVKIVDGVIELVDNPPKRDLTEATLYQKELEKVQLANQLLYAPKLELKKWFEQNNWVKTVSEEEQ